MTIEELKNEVIADVKGYVTDTAKSAFLNWVKEKILPAAKEMGTAYAEAVKATAEGKQGWVKFRDSMLIPGIISAALWAVELAIDKTMTIDN